MARRTRAGCCLIIAMTLFLWGCSDATEPSPACAVSVSPTAFSPCVIAGTLAASVSAPSTCAWNVSSGSSWLTILSGSSGAGSGTVLAGYSSNFDAPREGTFTVQTSSSPTRLDVRVSQAGCRYGATPESFTFESDGGLGTFDVIQQTEPYECGGPKQNACQWSAITETPWISVTTAMPQTGDQPVRFLIAPTASILPRTGTIVIRDRIVHVLQAGR